MLRLICAFCLLSGLFLGGAGCSSSPQIGAYRRAIRERGFIAFNQPVGDVRNVNDWNKFGPGAIIRIRNQAYYYPAQTVIGATGVQSAMDPKNASPVNLFSGRKVSGYDLDGKGGWTLDAVNAIAGTIGVKQNTTVDLQFGPAHLANPLGEGEMHRVLSAASRSLDPVARKALQRGQYACVQNAVWSESVRYTFRQATSNGASVSYKLSAQEIAALSAKGYKVIDGAIQVSAPTFIAYTPLPAPGRDVGQAR